MTAFAYRALPPNGDADQIVPPPRNVWRHAERWKAEGVMGEKRVVFAMISPRRLADALSFLGIEDCCNLQAGAGLATGLLVLVGDVVGMVITVLMVAGQGVNVIELSDGTVLRHPTEGLQDCWVPAP